MERIVKVEIPMIKNTRRDVRNSKGVTTKTLEGANRVFAPFLSRKTGALITGTTKEEFKELFPNRDYYEFFKDFRVRVSTYNRVLDLDVPNHKVSYNLLMIHPGVCTKLEEYNPAVHHVILTDEEAKAEAQAKFADKKFAAYKAITDMSIDKQRKFLYMFGIDSSKGSDAMIKSKLLEKADADPEKFMLLYNDPNKETKVLLLNLISKGVLRRSGSAIFYGDQLDSVQIGVNEELAVEFLKEKKNQELKLVLMGELDQIEKQISK